MAGAEELSVGIRDQANALLAQAEEAARSGDFSTADSLYNEAQRIIGTVDPSASFAFNLVDTADTSAAIRASSTEARIIGSNLQRARLLQDPNSAERQRLRGSLLDPSIAAIDAGEKGALEIIDANQTNAERAIASERAGAERAIRDMAGSQGAGFNPAAQAGARSRVANLAALERARVSTEVGAQKALIVSEAAGQRGQIMNRVNQFLEDFTVKFSQDSVTLAQQWVDGTAGVRDNYQLALDQIELFAASVQEQRSLIAAAAARQARAEDKARKAFRREAIFGFATGSLPIATVFGGQGPGSLGKSSGQGAGGGVAQGSAQGLGASLGGFEDEGGSAFGAVAGPNGAISTTGSSESAFGAVAGPNGAISTTGGGGGGGGGGLGSLLTLLFA